MGGGEAQQVFSRRGMSPLIATILLMAFAVALGGMIMNWSIDISINGECEEIRVSVSQFCTQEGNIILRGRSLENGVPLLGVKLLVSTEDIEHAVNVKNSALQPGEPLALQIPFTPTDATRVDLLGVIGSEANPYTCEENPIERVDPIRPC